MTTAAHACLAPLLGFPELPLPAHSLADPALVRPALTAAMVLCCVWEATEDGDRYTAETGHRVYALSTACSMIAALRSTTGLRMRAQAAVAAALRDPSGEAPGVAEAKALDAELCRAVTYLIDSTDTQSVGDLESQAKTLVSWFNQ